MVADKLILDVIKQTTKETIEKMNEAAFTDRNKMLRNETFQNAEKLLYNYKGLVDHVKDIEEYVEMARKEKSASIIRYSKNSVSIPEFEEIERERIDSYNRTKRDVKRIENALNKIIHKKGYEVIELRYFYKKQDKDNPTYTYEEIAEMLAGKKGYSDKLNEKTVRKYKNELVRELAVLLFGSDAV